MGGAELLAGRVGGDRSAPPLVEPDMQISRIRLSCETFVSGLSRGLEPKKLESKPLEVRHVSHPLR